MRTTEVAKLLGMHGDVSRMALRLGIAAPIGTGQPRSWSPGDALALWIVKDLGGSSRFAEGALKAGEALDAGYPPSYLVTRGGAENVVVLESESPAATDEMVGALLMQATDAGACVRVVPLRQMVRRLSRWMNELVDA